MSWRAIKDEFSFVNSSNLPSLPPVATTTGRTGTAIDLANTTGNAILFVPGLWTDGTHTPKLTESSDNTTYTDVAAADLVGSFSAVSSTATAIGQKISYIGKLRYVRPVITGTGTTTGMIAGFQQVLSNRKQP